MRNVEVHSATYPALIQTSVAAFWHAPLCFVSAQIFRADITGIYDRLRLPVWMSHGVRGDFVDYRGKERFANRGNWRFTVFDSGALPYFEHPQAFGKTMLEFMDSSAATSTSPRPACRRKRGGLDFSYRPELPVVYAPKPDVNRIKICRLQCMHIGPHVERAVPP